MPEKIIHVDQIGNVFFRKNKRSKNVSIVLKPLKGIVVTLPYYASYNYALRVVEQKRPWILAHLPKVEQIEQKATVYTEDTLFTTKSKKLIIESHLKDTVTSKINSHTITINYPFGYDVKDPSIQRFIKISIEKALRMEAKQYLPARTSELAKKYNFRFNKVFVKNAKTLWGSCSARNNINLNMHLMRLPDHLVDYVIIHELCHTVEKNHGKGFWSLMNQVLGDAKKFSKELRNYSIQIY